MAVSVSSVIDQAAYRASDPKFATIGRDAWLLLLNQVSREITSRLRIIRRVARATIYPNVSTVVLPGWCVELTQLQFRESEAANWVDLRDFPEDEYRLAMNRSNPTGWPSRYFESGGHVNFDSVPTQQSTNGLRATCWAVARDIPSYNGTFIALPDTLRDFLVRGMGVEAMALEVRVDEYSVAKQAWLEELETRRSRMEDIGGDRRSRMRVNHPGLRGLV